MRIKVQILALSLLLQAAAQSSLRAPEIGQIALPGGARKVLGIPGAFVLSPVDRSDVSAVACSSSWCVAKTAGHVVAGDREFDAPLGSALIAVDGDRGLLYFPETRAFAMVTPEGLHPEEWKVAGEVLALRLTKGKPEAAVRNGDQIRILRRDNSTVQILTSEGPVELFAGGTASFVDGQVRLEHDSGKVVSFKLPEVQAFFRPAPHYLGVRAAGGTFLIRWTEGQEELWQLPEPAE